MIQVMAESTPIGTRIARRRQVLGMRQEDLAARVGVSRAAVANWESGKHFPQRKLGAVEEALGISLDSPAGPEPDIMPEGLREAIREELSPEEARRVEAAVEAALRDEPMPARRRRASL